jgi:nickel-dependent lactate racemase
MQIISVPQLAWYNPRPLELQLPAAWEVEMCYMAGYDCPAVDKRAIRAALQKPLGAKPLRELARGKKEVAIVFDDLTRGTRPAQIVDVVLEELAAAGVSSDNIRFICGLALHGGMNRSDFVRKLGEDVVSRFPVFNHNPFGNCSYVGTTKTYKTKVCINDEYLKCDLRILINSCVPHPVAGFGGGAKLLMPGLASVDTINWHHRAGQANMDPVDITSETRPTAGMSYIEGNLFRQDIEEAAEIAGIDLMITTLLNLWSDNSWICAGDWKQVFAEAAAKAKLHYRTPKTLDKDIVIANNYAKVSECMIGMAASIPMVTPTGGDIVNIANAPEGQVTHYLAGTFGKSTYAVLYTPCQIPDSVNRFISYNEYPHRGSDWYPPHDKIFYLSKWDKVLEALVKEHGQRAKVAVIPDATNQYFAWYD